MSQKQRHCTISPSTIRVCDKHKKVRINSNTEIGVSRSNCRSVQMELSLPQEKVTGIQLQCKFLLNTMTVKDLAKLLKKLSSTIQAVLPVPHPTVHISTVSNESSIEDRSKFPGHHHNSEQGILPGS